MINGAIRVSAFGTSDPGRVRAHNEDVYRIAGLETGDGDGYTDVREHVVGPRGMLFVVADGMGGAVAGEVASTMAADLIVHHLTTVWRADPDPSAPRFAYRLREAVELANARLHRHGRQEPAVRGMGTTVTAVGVHGRDLYLAQVGDSRAYLIRRGAATQLTKDQSLVQRLIDAGEITEAEAEHHERRNIILQALGPDPKVTVDLTRQTLRRGDLLLVCSDGLSTHVPRKELAALAEAHPAPRALCPRLVALANERGGRDNITVIAARFEGAALEEPTDAAPAGYGVEALPELPSPNLLAAERPPAATPAVPSASPAPGLSSQRAASRVSLLPQSLLSQLPSRTALYRRLPLAVVILLALVVLLVIVA